MDNIFIILAFAIPLLTIFLIIMIYSYTKNMRYYKKTINTLSLEGVQLLDKNKNKDKITNENWLTKKLQYAGFTRKGSDFIFIFICIAFGLLASFFIYFIAKSKVIFIFTLLIFAIIAKSKVIFIFTLLIFATFPLLVLNFIIKSRQEEFNINLKEIIDKVTSMMKSGVGFEQALKKSVMTCKSKLTKDIFGIYINEKAILGEDKCFEKMFKIIESKELRIFYLTMSIGRQSGGKFSNTLEKLRKTLNDQGEIKNEITSSTREIKVGTYMIIGLVFITYYMMNSALNNSLNAHFFGSDVGKIQMFFIIVWVAFGIFINSLLSKIK